MAWRTNRTSWTKKMKKKTKKLNELSLLQREKNGKCRQRIRVVFGFHKDYNAVFKTLFL